MSSPIKAKWFTNWWYCPLILLSLCMYGCEKGKRIEERSSDGKIVLYSYNEDANKQIDGDYIENFPNGSPKRRAYYTHGRREGLFEKYHENGRLFVKAVYRDGGLLNIITYQDSAGNPLPKGDLVDGNGTVNEYESKGRLIGFGRLKNGWFNGYYYLNSARGVIDSILYQTGSETLPQKAGTLNW